MSGRRYDVIRTVGKTSDGKTWREMGVLRLQEALDDIDARLTAQEKQSPVDMLRTESFTDRLKRSTYLQKRFEALEIIAGLQPTTRVSSVEESDAHLDALEEQRCSCEDGYGVLPGIDPDCPLHGLVVVHPACPSPVSPICTCNWEGGHDANDPPYRTHEDPNCPSHPSEEECVKPPPTGDESPFIRTETGEKVPLISTKLHKTCANGQENDDFLETTDFPTQENGPIQESPDTSFAEPTSDGGLLHTDCHAEKESLVEEVRFIMEALYSDGYHDALLIGTQQPVSDNYTHDVILTVADAIDNTRRSWPYPDTVSVAGWLRKEVEK